MPFVPMAKFLLLGHYHSTRYLTNFTYYILYISDYSVGFISLPFPFAYFLLNDIYIALVENITLGALR